MSEEPNQPTDLVGHRDLASQPDLASQIDLVTAMGRLLSSHTLREEFECSPEELFEKLNLAEQDRPSFVALDIAEIRDQARILIRKRWHEVKRLIPETVASLGAEGLRSFNFSLPTIGPKVTEGTLLMRSDSCDSSRPIRFENQPRKN